MKIDNWKYKLDLFKYSKNRQTTTKKMVITIAAFFISLIFGSLFVLTQNVNPFDAIGIMFQMGWENLLSRNGGLVEMSVIALSALSFIIAQKAGMFNVGVTGQLWGGTIFAYFIGQFMGDVPIVLGQILMIVFAGGFGVVTGMFLTWLKTRFNVHEVVSSILFNFFVFFIGWYLAANFLTEPGGPGLTSIVLSNNLRLFDAGTDSAWIPGLILTLLVLFGTWFLFKFTKFGWKITSVGLSESAAKYSGYPVNRIKMIGMSVSGAIAGVLGLLVYTGLFESIQIPTSNSLPGFGFNGIAVGLLALWNPIGIGFFSFIIGILNAGRPFLSTIGSTPILMDLILGIIIYGSALLSGLIIYKPWLWVIKKIKGERFQKGHFAYIDFLIAKIDGTETELYYLRGKAMTNFKAEYKSNFKQAMVKNWKEYVVERDKIVQDYFEFKNAEKALTDRAIKHQPISLETGGAQ